MYRVVGAIGSPRAPKGGTPTGKRTTLDPDPLEVEGARSLADDAREALGARGMSDRKIERLAERYVAEGRTKSLDDFIEWADAGARA